MLCLLNSLHRQYLKQHLKSTLLKELLCFLSQQFAIGCACFQEKPRNLSLTFCIPVFEFCRHLDIFPEASSDVR